eukprot:4463270-Pleurochrysis_carterae.AAC.2
MPRKFSAFDEMGVSERECRRRTISSRRPKSCLSNEAITPSCEGENAKWKGVMAFAAGAHGRRRSNTLHSPH